MNFMFKSRILIVEALPDVQDIVGSLLDELHRAQGPVFHELPCVAQLFHGDPLFQSQLDNLLGSAALETIPEPLAVALDRLDDAELMHPVVRLACQVDPRQGASLLPVLLGPPLDEILVLLAPLDQRVLDRFATSPQEEVPRLLAHVLLQKEAPGHLGDRAQALGFYILRNAFWGVAPQARYLPGEARGCSVAVRALLGLQHALHGLQLLLGRGLAEHPDFHSKIPHFLGMH